MELLMYTIRHLEKWAKNRAAKVFLYRYLLSTWNIKNNCRCKTLHLFSNQIYIPIHFGPFLNPTKMQTSIIARYYNEDLNVRH